ncbi:MAG: Do family serine endopeptidase [Gammaproteobacteria bacterium]|nr:Do family serine endopeptidase [Gammaproteobacteria bacterium]NIN37816.1 Do family serine endopeptidase [Gammaproteobacteria bacterium]NIO23476.1 Do family serine endopeptidase [Gammaproteobacteria bacterium]NIO64092.1 Do family serine endopeptidase [Gammaproteobacteria bacterium]NIP63105.1 Do family serine endopeptidase [Gammaproteobacteria bacterium]
MHVALRLRSSLLAALILLPAAAWAASPPLPSKDGIPTLAPLLRDVTPAVVNISVLVSAPALQNPLMRDPFFRRFFEDFLEQPQQRPQLSAGSGVVIDAERGYVVTNHHVIESASEIIVTLKDRRKLEAELVGSDPGTDIALLKVAPEGLTALELGDSDALEVGDFVVAIGNPFGLGQTVTSGIVSALGRTGLNVHGYEDFIQTDASINPGNSGGALINLKGELIGINSVIIGPSGGNVGIGFAVPSNMTRSIVEQLAEYGEVRRGRLGVLIQDLTPELAEALNLTVSEGAVITRIEPDSPAEKAGLAAGDVIVAADAAEVTSSAELRNVIGLVRVGEEVNLTVLRDGGRRNIKVRVGVVERATYAGSESAPQLSGAVFQAMGPEHPLHGQIDGVVVADVERGGRAWRNNIRPGDVIVGINRERVRSVEELSRALRRVGRTVAVDIIRDGAQLLIVIQ